MSGGKRGGVGGQTIGVPSVLVGKILGIGDGRLDGFGDISREAISAKDIGFLDVAGASGTVTGSGVVGGLGSEVSVVVSRELAPGVSINASSLHREVSKRIGIAATGFSIQRGITAGVCTESGEIYCRLAWSSFVSSPGFL